MNVGTVIVAGGNRVGGASYDDAPPLRPTSAIARAIFADPDSRAIEARLALLAPADATVLIVGEIGTGKEAVARELHALSGRKGPFLAINCAALADGTAEAELFGHHGGAPQTEPLQMGWFEAASGGTLLLDEVSGLSLRIQTKLLRVLQTKEITRVGSRTACPVDVRVIATTNTDLHAAAAAGGFRRDLLLRLDIATVPLHPLRERRLDIEPLALHFLDQYGEKFARRLSFAPEALAALVRQNWPGNVRELDNVIHRAVLLTTGSVITLNDLSQTQATACGTSEPTGRATLESLLRQLADGWIADAEPDLLRRAARVLVQAGFDFADGNQVRAADVLGVSRNTLRTQLGHLGVIPPRRRKMAPKASGTRLRIGIQKFGTSALLQYDAEFAASLAAQDVTAEWEDFQTGPPLINALHAAQIDMCCTGEVSPIVAQASGTQIVYLAYERADPASVAIMVRASSPVETMSDLRGRRVALSRGANVQLMLIRALERCGMTLADIQPIYMPPRLHPAPDTIEGVDAWAMWDPFLSKVQNSDQFRKLLDGTGLIPNRRFYITRRKCLDSMPKILQAALNGVFRVGHEAAREPAEAARVLSGAFGIEAQRLEPAMRRLGPGARWLDDVVIAEQQVIADDLYRLGITPKPVHVADAAWLGAQTGAFASASTVPPGSMTSQWHDVAS